MDASVMHAVETVSIESSKDGVGVPQVSEDVATVSVDFRLVLLQEAA